QVGVHHALLRVRADRTAPDEVRGEGNVEERLAPGSAWLAIDLAGGVSRRLMGRRNPRRVGATVPLGGAQAVAEETAFPRDPQAVVQRLHHQEDDAALTPAPDREAPQKPPRVPR